MHGERVNAPQFQFQTGSIKSLLADTGVQAETVFQFQTGSIKRGIVCSTVIFSSGAFQFQTGSIKSFCKIRYNILTKLFQFQTGSIKSRGIPRTAPFVFGFNSKLVRLKELDDIAKQFELTRFNSKLVRLKARN